GLEEVIEDDHAVVEAEAEIRQAAVVRWRIRQALDIADRVVTRVANAAAEETWQPVQRRRAIGGQLLLQQQQRVGMLRLDDFVALLQLDTIAERLEAQERPGAEEAVASQPLAADDALEEKGPISLLNLAEGANRRQRIAGELAIDRHQVALAGQADELVEGRMVAHDPFTIRWIGPALSPRRRGG